MVRYGSKNIDERRVSTEKDYKIGNWLYVAMLIFLGYCYNLPANNNKMAHLAFLIVGSACVLGLAINYAFKNKERYLRNRISRYREWQKIDDPALSIKPFDQD